MRWVKIYRTQLSHRAAGKTSETQQSPNGVARARAAGKTRNICRQHTRYTQLTNHTQMFMHVCGRMHARQARNIRAGKTCLDT